MFKIQNLLVLLIALYGCGDSKKNEKFQESINSEHENKIKFTTESLTKVDENCKRTDGLCTKISISYPIVINAPSVQAKQKLNSAIYSVVLNSSIDPGGKINNIDTAAEKFLEDYRSFNEKIQNSLPWSIEIDVKVIHNRNNIFTIVSEENSYLGGAHPQNNTKYHNYNIKTGELLKLSDIFTDLNTLYQLAEEEFRKKRELAQSEDLSAGDLWSENEEFQLTENFGFKGDTLILYFNNYEIASYAQGPTKIEIPLEKLQLVKIPV